MKVGRFVIVFLLLMGFLIAFGDNGLVDNYVMKEKLKILKSENSRTMEENDGLKKEVILYGTTLNTSRWWRGKSWAW